jgi:hypothetical protein
VPVTLRRVEGEKSPATVIVCNPLPLAGEASHHLIESIVDALVVEGAAAATYESACEGMILEDFDKYSASDSARELTAVLKHVETSHGGDAPVILLGYGVGAIIAAVVAGEITAPALCLVNPLLAVDVTASRNQSGAGDAGRAVLPAEFINTVGTLNPLESLSRFSGSMLVLNGPADRAARADSAQQYITAVRSAGGTATHLLIACGDHAFTDPSAKQAAIEQIVQFATLRG